MPSMVTRAWDGVVAQAQDPRECGDLWSEVPSSPGKRIPESGWHIPGMGLTNTVVAQGIRNVLQTVCSAHVRTVC